MTRHELPRGMVRATDTTGTIEGYMPGFGNDFETEALPGALPQGMNSPQKCNYGLYGEQLSGTAFTAPSHQNERTWCYRIRPSVKHTHRFAKIDLPYWKSAPHVDPDVISLGQYRWDPVPQGDAPLDWLTGMRTMTTAGDVNTQVGMASHIYLVTALHGGRSISSPPTASCWSSRRRGGCASAPSSGIIDLEPQEIAVIPRGLVYRVEVLEGPARGFVCENYGQKFMLPGRGPIGANCMANRRDFKSPVAAFEDRDAPSTVTVKWCGQFHRTEIGHSPLDVVAWHGNYAPVKYDLRTYCPVGSILFDHPDPSIFTVLTAASGVEGTANIDFVLFRERWMVAEDTFRPPWYHKNVMSELMGNIHGQYDAKPQGFVPGGMSLHNMMLPHGPDREAFEGASNARAEAAQARQHHVVHVRDAVPAAPDRLRRQRGAVAGRLHRLLGEPGKEVRRHTGGKMSIAQSWVASANGDTDFPLQNLPCGVFDDGRGARCGVAIGDMILDVREVDLGIDGSLFAEPAWNAVMAAGASVWSDLRAALTDALSDEGRRAAVEPHLVPMDKARLLMPFRVSEYTDFYAGKHHATNVGTMFRGAENALPPNWLSIPIGYNGRASSVVVSGTPVRRPWGQVKGPQDELPRLAPSARFDIELEMGAIVGQPSEGMVSVAEAEEMIFGYVLLNDWSARDIQAWEYQPLGPFQAKATATTISPWIVTKAALEPFRVSTPERERPLLPYLREPQPGLYDIALEVGLTPEGSAETVLARTSYREMYYSAAQQLAHHTTVGLPDAGGRPAGLRHDLGARAGGARLASGTELGRQGADRRSATATTRSFIEDNDTLTLRGAATGDGYRVGFGACTGQVLPAADLPDWAKE